MGLGIETMPRSTNPGSPPPGKVIRFKIKFTPPPILSVDSAKSEPPISPIDADLASPAKKIDEQKRESEPKAKAKARSIPPATRNRLPAIKLGMKKKVKSTSPATGGADPKPVSLRKRNRKGTPKRSPLF